MNDYSQKLLDKSLDAIEAAEGLLDMGKPEFAAGRAYYAMFPWHRPPGQVYVAEALLSEKGLEFSQHGQVIGAYGLHFAKTKELDPKYHRWLMDGLDVRISGDYGVDTDISENIVADMINHARDFLNDAKKYMEKQE